MRPLAFTEAFSLQRTLSHGVLAVRVALGPMWLGGLLMMIGDGCNPGNLGDLLPDRDDKKQALLLLPRAGDALLSAASQRGFDLPSELTGFVVGAVIAAVLVGILAALAMFALGCWISTGFVRMHVGILEREDDSLAPLFSGRDRFWSMAGYKGLSGLAVSAAFVASVWPGAMLAGYGYLIDRQVWMIGGAGLAALLVIPVVTYVALGTFLGELAVALDGMDSVHALRRSWQLAAGNRWPMLVFVVACGLLQLLSTVGLLACCVGALATMPLARAVVGFAKTEGYLLFTRGREGASAFQLWQRAAGVTMPAKPGVATPAAVGAPRPVSVRRPDPLAVSMPAAPPAPPPGPAPASAPMPAPPPPAAPKPTWQGEPSSPAWQPAVPELPRFEPPPGQGALPPQPSSQARPDEPRTDDQPPPRDPRKG